MASPTPGRSPLTVQSIAGIPYFIADAKIYSGLKLDNITGPCTVIPYMDSLTTDYIRDVIANFNSEDDVWSADFLETVLFDSSPGYAELTEDVINFLSERGTRNISSRLECAAEQRLPWGPYWLENDVLHKVFRLYSDCVDALVMSTVPSEENPMDYRQLGIAINGESNPASLSIAVPSRMYYKRSTESPLAGLRIAVKDNTKLQGVRTGGSSRSYTCLYGPSKDTAPAVRKLLELDAIVVGKTKTTQFADTEWPTADWVDFHAPFSPRADGYQSPSGSSAGSGAAMAAFEWLDFATGTDGCGSLRAPAAVEGLFSIRPSHGITSTEGIIPWGAEFDTFGGFARDIAILEAVTRVLSDCQTPHADFHESKKIFYPTDFWPVANECQQTVFNDFIAKLERYTGTTCIPINLDDNWKANNPVGTNQSLTEYFHNTLPWTYAKTQYQTYKTFQEDYIKKFNHTPYFNPQAQCKLSWLPTITPEMHAQALTQLLIFQTWFEKHIISPSSTGESETLLLIPWTTGNPDYRDTYRAKPDWAGYGWFYYMLAPFA